jgi:hypothetical protein
MIELPAFRAARAAITEKYQRLGGSAGRLGKVVTDVTACPDRLESVMN